MNEVKDSFKLRSESIDPLFFIAARISTYDDDPDKETALGYGTGFFYTNPKGDLFLITSRHVIIDTQKCPPHIPNIVRLSLHANPDDLTKNEHYDIRLYEGVKRKWREPNPFADVAAIHLDVNDIERQDLLINSFSDDNLLPSKSRLQIGEDVLVIGYPLAIFYDDVFNLPVIRSGIVASAYPIPFKGQPYFLTDARLHEGTSGGPVITKLKDFIRILSPDGKIAKGERRFILLGVNMSTALLPKEVGELGLNAAVFASKVQDITR